MEGTSTHVLVVAYRTATTRPLLDAVRKRAAQGPSTFTLLVPTDRVADPQTESPEQALELALPLLREAAGGHVEGILGYADPLVAVRDAARERAYDEVIISTLPQGVSRWLRRDLPHRVREELGLPVTHLVAERPPVLPVRLPASLSD